MKLLCIIPVLISPITYAQLSIDDARALQTKNQLGSYSYHEQFIGYKGYGAPVILTADGGAAIFGDYSNENASGGKIVKVDKTGKQQWQRLIQKQFDEMESQSVVQDMNGNFYVFMLSYDRKRYRGGTERIVCLDKTGRILWDKTLGNYELLDRPTISYIRALNDGQIALRGHIIIDKPEEGKDPRTRYWEGWINNTGKLTQKSGDFIDWAKQEWQKLYKPE